MSSNSSPNLPRRFPNFFSNPAWNAIGVFVTILIFIITIYLQQGSLAYELIDASPLVQGDIGENWKLSYNTEPVNKPFSIIYLIKNTGRTDIRKEDYQGNGITIDLGMPSNKILNVFVSKTEPPTLKAILEREETVSRSSSNQSEIEIKPLFLGAGDSITLKAIVENFDPIALGRPIAAISGIKEIRQSYSSTQKPKLCLPISQPKWLVFCFILGLSSLVALLAKLTLPSLRSQSKLTIFIVSFILVLSILGSATLLFN